jgi:hypothetical protein
MSEKTIVTSPSGARTPLVGVVGSAPEAFRSFIPKFWFLEQSTSLKLFVSISITKLN